ncbi:thioesterase II family protein [Xenorhabdus szentirmaii]|uniref:Yersiniabactin synthetase, thioesterase component n=2 Tax=Xenorhabdus szentirmaii TaxID=290112 RepID=W1IU55_9GAMM|nr:MULTISPECIES: alpha/beta fold hydrolase [Xenorhabdus]PHM32419.1 yersiniabactin synthetase, thioesterase component Irp4 [Xenorhabdus szentirmaii DSM 16338]CDL80760.1 Yersiniabactin synthetase, thioesterase component [Xenorhabdus szentirmaii DSM 16338]
MKWTLPAHPMIRPCLASRDEPKYTLLICPFAGGSSSAFRQWTTLENQDIAVSLVIYPGRDSRMNEHAATQIAPLAQSLSDLIVSLSPQQRKNLILVGHSMGAQVAFEACQRLEQHHCPPKALVLSGCHAPHLQSRRKLSGLPDREFIEQLIDIGGCSPLLQEDPGLLSLFLPMLRADFCATEHYHRVIQSDSVKLQTPTLLLYGNEDKEASALEVQQWHHWLAGDNQDLSHGCQEIVGNHFYITQKPQSFIRHITQFMQEVYPQEFA